MKKRSIDFGQVGKILATFILVLAIVVPFSFFGLFYFLDSVLHDGHMHFPKPHGTMAVEPHLTVMSDGLAVAWTANETCHNNSFQVVTDDYVEDEGWTHWLGGGSVTCETRGEVMDCWTPLEETLDRLEGWPGGFWLVAEGGFCGADDSGYFRSKRLELSGRLALDGDVIEQLVWNPQLRLTENGFVLVGERAELLGIVTGAEEAAVSDGRCTSEQVKEGFCLQNPFYLRRTGEALDIPVSPAAMLVQIDYSEEGHEIGRWLHIATEDLVGGHLPGLVRAQLVDGEVNRMVERYVP